jgi:ankyrin repeat protein
VRYQLDQILREDFEAEDVLNALQKLPTDLPEAYDAIIERIKVKKGLDLAYLILSWIFHTPCPIRMGELIEAVSVQKGNVDLNPKLFMSPTKLLSRCERLVTYDRMSDEARFAHFTVFEYLQTYHENSLSKKVQLATVSLRYLIMVAEEFRGYGQPELYQIFPFKFLELASLYWGQWARDEGQNHSEFWILLLELHQRPQLLWSLHRTLLSLREDRNQCYCEAFTILHLLVYGDLKNICEMVLSIPGNEDFCLPEPLVQSNMTGRISAMAKSCQRDIDKSCDIVGTALHLATNRDGDQLFRLLINHQANFNVKNSKSRSSGCTPIHIAAQSNSISKLEFLHVQGADLDILDDNSNPPLYYAIYGCTISCVKLLLEKGCASAVRVDGKPSTPIHLAAQSGNIEILQLLVEAYPTLANETDVDGRTPLHHASRSKDARTMEFLLSLPEMNPSKQDDWGETPLHTAAELGNIEPAKLLLRAGSDPTIKMSRDYTPLDLALVKGHIHVARVLSDHTQVSNDSQELAPAKTNSKFIQYMLSRIEGEPEELRYYELLARVHLSEGNTELAYQYFDRFVYLLKYCPFFLYCGYCEILMIAIRHHPLYICSSCSSRHMICKACFQLLSAYLPPNFLTDHVFHPIPSKQYPASISAFVESGEVRRLVTLYEAERVNAL